MGKTLPGLMMMLLAATGCDAAGSGAPAQPAAAAVAAAATAAAPSAQVPDLATRHDGSDWPHFLGPTGDNKSTETGILKTWPENGPPIVWHMPVGEGYALTTVSRGRLFLFDRHDPPLNAPGADPNQRQGGQNRLTCMNAENGKEIWRFEYPTDFQDLLGYSGGPRCAPLIDGDRVYILGGEGVLHCLNVLDGKVLWKHDTLSEFHVVKNFFGVGASPVIEGDLLIMQVGGSPDPYDKSPDGQPIGPPTDIYAAAGKVIPGGSGIVAFDKHTGEVVYKITDELASYSTPTLATINGRRWCFDFARGGLVGFDPATGKVDFHYPWRADKLESVNASSPIVIGDQVLISETYDVGASLLKVKPGGFDVVWSDKDKRGRAKTLMCHWNTPIYLDGYVYGCSGRNSGDAELRCVELTTGQVMWSVPRLTRSTLLYVDGHFVCMTEFGQLILFKVNPQKFEPVAAARPVDPKAAPPADGAELKPLLDYPCWPPPVLSHGLLYLHGKDHLVCMQLIPPKTKPAP
jgi:outer membrane protein assembly factor BamB